MLLRLLVLFTGFFLIASTSWAQAPDVIVTRAAVKAFPLSAEALGNARANEAIEVRAEITAAITAIRFEEGQWVEQGTVLVELENAEQLAELAAAKAALVESRSQYQRAEELYRTNVVATSQLEQLKAQFEANEAAVRAAQSRLDHTIIRAPFSGRLGLRRVSVGAVVDTDTVITTLDDTSRIKLDFDVPEVFVARLEPGLRVLARSAAWPDQHFEGQVTTIDTRLDPVTRTVTVRALLPNEEGYLRPGMFLTVSLLKDDVLALMVPEEAIVPERSKQFVFVVTPGDLVEMREVRTGRRRPGEVEVLQGLADGEWVISEGTQKARDGEPVNVASRVEAG
ncbi:efflux RND transporter periplasmic adaptor subunit [Elongatibacter sediminis]|uniref:Efflux RND transporter periplasmic adaptor subunit n=1 Tax=Elongatibacter sediminis TaxID=3119006 RepID=A0AAW9R5E7_9GAMM